MNFFGRIKQGNLILNDIKRFNLFIKKQKDCVVEVRVKKYRKQRSTDQNSLYWMWLGIIGDDLGYDADELHATFKAMFLTDLSKKLPLVRSTTALNTQEFSLYLERIDRQASELGIVLPHPEDWRE